MKKHRILISALTVLAISAPAALAGGSASSGTLTLNASVNSTYTFVARPDCPPDTPETTRECVRFVSLAAGLPGLGQSTITYVKYFDDVICPNQVLSQKTVLVDVAGKGQINVAMVPECGDYAPTTTVRNGTIAGGTGKFAGASGSLRIVSSAAGPQCGAGGCRGSSVDTWTGSLSVPGLEFDVTPPVLQGARPKSVKVPWKTKRVRVRYSVTAQDDTGGPVPAKCLPASGTRFKVGRTKVKCTAEDSSANVATASFMVTVKRARR